jgi:hypothetical protein
MIEKSAEFVPVIAMEVIETLVEPWFVITTTLDLLGVPRSWSPKLRLAGTKPTTVPMPLRLTVCGLWAALSVKLSVPVRLPVAVGRKAT